MVTKRGRRWIQRGVMAAIIAAVAALGLAGWFTSSAIEGELLVMGDDPSAADPSTINLAFTQLDIPGPLGNYPAWSVPADGEEDTWAVFVHGQEGSRAQALELLPTVVDHGIPSLVVTYRNGEGAPPGGGGHHGLGADEWEDLEAAVVFALGSGAQDIVLVGHGSGGAVVLTFLRRSVWAERVVGVVLDSPYLDPGAMVDEQRAEDNVPGFLSGWGKALATFRFGVDWPILDQVIASGEFSTQMLLIQGDADAVAPVRVADAFAESRPDLVQYLRLEGTGHLGGHAADPERYTGVVAHFLRRVAVGPSELPEVVPETGVE
jgi:pimeloyl-ACP methyl ester carboxylesterase